MRTHLLHEALGHFGELPSVAPLLYHVIEPHHVVPAPPSQPQDVPLFVDAVRGVDPASDGELGEAGHGHGLGMIVHPSLKGRNVPRRHEDFRVVL